MDQICSKASSFSILQRFESKIIWMNDKSISEHTVLHIVSITVSFAPFFLEIPFLRFGDLREIYGRLISIQCLLFLQVQELPEILLVQGGLTTGKTLFLL